MLIRRRQSWQLPESVVTDESVYRNRRQLLKKMGFVGLGGLLAPHANAGLFDFFSDEPSNTPTSEGAFQQRPLEYRQAASTNLTVTAESKATSYNNFYEFGVAKSDPKDNAQQFVVDPWQLTITGLVDKPVTLGYEDLFAFPLEERIYRMRCVEAWSMVIPWIGVPLATVLKKAGIKTDARYVAFETLEDPEQMPGQRSRFFGGGISYPYVEGLRLDEAMHPLTMLAVGIYGKTLPPQNGAPIRLVVPWKYGFKNIKSIVKMSLVKNQPPTTWNKAAANEYGFYANVNPNVDHPRWSQASERLITKGGLGADQRVPTLMFNGYQEQVAGLYQDMNLRKYF